MGKNKPQVITIDNTLGIYQQLSFIQRTMKAPKGQTNTFGKYKYRNCEDILEAVKPLLAEGTSIILSDEIWVAGDRYYIKATAKLTNGKSEVSNSAYAREALIKKGMDESQITGATSSYARKYALNGLLAIDDTKDADSQDNSTSGGSVTNNNKASTVPPMTKEQKDMILQLLTQKGKTEESLAKLVLKAFNVKDWNKLYSNEAVKVTNILLALPDKVKEEELDLDEIDKGMQEADNGKETATGGETK